MAPLSSFIVTRNDRYAHDCKDGAAVTRWRGPLNTRTTIEQRGAVRFLWAKDMAAKDIYKDTSSNPLKQHLSEERFPDNDAVE